MSMLNFCKNTKKLLILISCLLSSITILYAQELIRFEKGSHNLHTQSPLKPSEMQWLKNHGPIKVAVKSGWMPIEFQLENQSHRGYTIDYLQKIANLYQINFELVPYTEDSRNNDADIISSVSGKSLINKNYHLLSKPVLVIPYALYFNKNKTNTIEGKSLGDMGSATVAYFSRGELKKNLIENFPKLKLAPVDIADEAFHNLKLGTADVYIGNEFVVDYHIEVHRLDFVKKSGITPFTSSVTMAVRNDAPELSDIMEKATIILGHNNPDLMEQWRYKKSNLEAIFCKFHRFILPFK